MSFNYYRDNVANRYYAVNDTQIIIISLHHDENFGIDRITYHRGPKDIQTPEFASLLKIDRDHFIEFLQKYLRHSLGIYEDVISLLEREESEVKADKNTDDFL